MDASGKKIRGRSEGTITNYDQFGKRNLIILTAWVIIMFVFFNLLVLALFLFQCLIYTLNTFLSQWASKLQIFMITMTF